MAKKTTEIDYLKKTNTDPIKRAKMALGRLKRATSEMDNSDLPKAKEKLSSILQVIIDEMKKQWEPLVEVLKLCYQIKDEKLVLQAFGKLKSSTPEKIKDFIQKVDGLTQGERMYLYGVLRRNVSYFDGTLLDEIADLYDAKEYVACLALTRRRLKKIENDTFLFGYQGQCLYCLERYDEAILSFNRAIEIDAGLFAWWVLRGDCYSALEQYDRAIRDYSVSLTLDAKNWATYDKCARAMFFNGQVDKAIEYEEYAVKRGHSPEATLVLMQMYKTMGDVKRVRTLGKRGIKRFPDDKRFQEFLDEME